MFEVSDRLLRRLLQVNSFPLPTREQPLFFFGFRGCLPDAGDAAPEAFARAHRLVDAELDYLHPRCTLIQWQPWADPGHAVAVFPGSTVPNLACIAKARARGGSGANQLMTGYYPDYTKGVHHPNDPERATQAFVQTMPRPVRRSEDDLDFDTLDAAAVETPHDNLHAAWCEDVTGKYDSFSSAGCQVVVGYPDCRLRPRGDSGPWRVFKENAYAGYPAQQEFPYVLLNASEAAKVDPEAAASPRLRFGSTGPLVNALQRALGMHHLYPGKIDGQYGERTFLGVLAFQTARLGAQADDGIVGPRTALALGMDWPSFAPAPSPSV